MPNIAISNVGSQASPALYDENGVEIVPAVPAAPSPSIRITDEAGNEITLPPGVSRGFALGSYTIEVVE